MALPICFVRFDNPIFMFHFVLILSPQYRKRGVLNDIGLKAYSVNSYMYIILALLRVFIVLYTALALHRNVVE